MKILIIEDETHLAEALQEGLLREGYFVDCCTNGIDGLYQAETGVYDLILLDIMLPGMNGYDVLKTLRGKGYELPVIILTAKSQLDDKLIGFSSGADDYLTKPFEFKELLARIQAISKRNGKQSSNLLCVGTLHLNISTSEISSANSTKTITLSAKELQLLEYLMQNERQIISREQITERVWGYDSETDYNHVDVYISFLRKKLLFINASEQIKAVRGLGYRLEGGTKDDSPQT